MTFLRGRRERPLRSRATYGSRNPTKKIRSASLYTPVLASAQIREQCRIGLASSMKRVQVVPPEILRDEFIEPVLPIAWCEFFNKWQATRIRDIGGNLPTQGAMAKRLQPLLKNMEHAILREIGKLLAEA